MDGLGDFIKKISDGAKSFGDLLDRRDLQEALGKAGTVGSLISLGLGIYKQVKDQLQKDEERAFYSFFKVAFESAEESIPADTIPIMDVKDKNTKQELFRIFTKIDEWNDYLPDHPTIIQFRTLICDMLRRAHYANLVRGFVFKFNITLEEKVDNDPTIEPFKKWYTLVERTKDLIRHLEYSRSLIYKTDPIGQKTLAEYYVENDALLLTETWEKEDDYLWEEKDYARRESKASDLIISFLKEKPWYTVIGAPFGIGKTSLAVYLTSTIGRMYLEDPNNEYNYIPIFVPLKDKLNNIDEDQNSLDDKLRLIAGEGEGEKRKILIICDGLDEYGEAESKLMDILRKKRTNLTNMKVIITTRLEAGLPQKLNLSSYIRLLPFNKEQVAEFFDKYELPDITFDVLESYNLAEKEIFKPLFCWMFAIMRKSFDVTTVFKDLDSRFKGSMSRALIYQAFIHSIVRGKHKAKAEYEPEEKRILRKIAALRQMHDPLTRSMIIRGLEYYGISYNETMLKDVLDPILTSYFYLQSKAVQDMNVDFIHKSFREYLLAEYYLESILNDQGHYLNVGIPSPETISFLDGLLELLLENKNGTLNKFANPLTKSLLSQANKQDLSQSVITQTLWKNAQRYYEKEQIIFQTEPYEQNTNKIWHIVDFPISRYAELWIHRWLSLYVLNKLAPHTPIDKKMLADFMVKTSHTVPQLQMRLNKVDLSNQVLGNTLLTGADLSGANLSDADLSRAILLHADLSCANLSGANLSDANLYGANLSGAHLFGVDLSDANLSDANLYGANLSGAHLFGVDLSDANLSDANLSRAILLHADLSRVNLSDANLSDADLSRAILLHADLSRVNLYGANLSRVNLYGANLSDVKADDRTNFENAILNSAYPSSIVTAITMRSIGKGSSDTKSSIRKITKYTSDGKPINQ
jgi:uncharacterized protein YjbI with pentapeptide repeats